MKMPGFWVGPLEMLWKGWEMQVSLCLQRLLILKALLPLPVSPGFGPSGNRSPMSTVPKALHCLPVARATDNYL